MMQTDIRQNLGILFMCLFLPQILSRMCEDQCHCSDNVILCGEGDKVTEFPDYLDPSYTKLIIQGGTFGNNILTSDNLTGLKNIKSLSLIYTEIEAIESYAFSQLVNLKDLDLSFNRISRIHSKAFNNLELNSLQLSDQKVPLALSVDSFEGLSVKSLALRHNRLNEIKSEVFQSIRNLKELFISKNNIKNIPSHSFIREYFNNDDRLLDLTENPLKCDCSLDWLANRANVWSRKTQDLNITCRYEEKNQYGTLTGRYVTLEIAQFTTRQLCPKTDIQTIEVNLDQANDYFILKCTAVSRPKIDFQTIIEKFRSTYQNYPLDMNHIFDLNPPNLSWTYFNVLGNEIVTRKKQPSRNSNDDFKELDKNKSVLNLNVTLKEDLNSRNFTCHAWDSENEEQRIVVHLNGLTNLRKMRAKSIHKAPGIEGKTDNSLDDQNELTNERYNLFRKQFTMIEMFGAITGTFLVTLICLLAGSRCIQVYCRDKTHGHFHYSSEPSMISDTAKKDQTVLVGGKNYTYSGSTLTPATSSSTNATSVNSGQGHFMQMPTGTLPQTPQYLMANGQMYQNFTDAKNMTLLGMGGNPVLGNNPQITPNIMAAIWAAQQQQQSHSNSSGSGPYSPSTMTGHEYDIPRSMDFNGGMTLMKNPH